MVLARGSGPALIANEQYGISYKKGKESLSNTYTLYVCTYKTYLRFKVHFHIFKIIIEPSVVAGNGDGFVMLADKIATDL